MHVQGRRVDLGHLDSRHALQQAAHRAKGLADHAPALGQALLAIVQVVKTKVAGRANGTVRDALRLRGSHVHCGALPAGFNVGRTKDGKPGEQSEQLRVDTEIVAGRRLNHQSSAEVRPRLLGQDLTHALWLQRERHLQRRSRRTRTDRRRDQRRGRRGFRVIVRCSVWDRSVEDVPQTDGHGMRQECPKHFRSAGRGRL